MMPLQPLSTSRAPPAAQRRLPWRPLSLGRRNASPPSVRSHWWAPSLRSAPEPSQEPPQQQQRDAPAAVAPSVGSSSAAHPPNTCVAVVDCGEHVRSYRRFESLAIGPGGRFVAAAVDQQIMIWDTHPFELPAKLLHCFGMPGLEYCMAISEDGRWLMAASDRGLVAATAIGGRTYVLSSSCSGQAKWEEGKGRGQVQLEEGGKQELVELAAITAVAITPDGRYTVAGSEWGQLVLWDMQHSGPECYTVLPDRSTILAASISPDGQKVTAISSSDGVWTWEWKLQKLHKEPVTLPASTLWKDLHLSSDGKRATGKYKYWLATCRIGRPFKEVTNLSTSFICSCSATPDGRFAATGHDDKTVRIWDLERATWFAGLWPFQPPTWSCQTACLRGHTDTVGIVAISPDAKHVVSGSHHQAGLRVWQL